MPDPTPQVIELANAFRAQLLAREMAAASAMTRFYGETWRRLQGDIVALRAEIEVKRDAGEDISEATIWRLERMQAIQAQAERELAQFAQFSSDIITANQREAIAAGERNANDLMLAMFPPGSINISFAQMPTEAVETLAGFLQDGSPLQDVIAKYAADSVAGFSNTMVTGIAAGWNPRKLARELRDAFGVGLGEALRISRTEQMRAYRASTLHAYRNSGGIVEKWERMAALDRRVCLACIMLDGTIYELEDEMEDHANGRCLVFGTLIQTHIGWIPIEKVRVDDFVMTHLHRWRRVVAVSNRTYSGEILKIKSAKMTPEHMVLTLRGWIQAKDLRAADTLAMLYPWLVRESRRKIVQPSFFKHSFFLASCWRFLSDLCQGGSSSTASIELGNAKSMLKNSMAYSGMGYNPELISAIWNINSKPDWFFAAFCCRVLARLRKASGVWLRSTRSLIKSGLAAIWRRTCSCREMGSIWHSFISRMSVRVLMPFSAVNSRYVACSSMYRRASQSQIGSPSFFSNSRFHCMRLMSPMCFPVFSRPRILARCNTALLVRPGNKTAISFESLRRNAVRMILSSCVVQRLPAIVYNLLNFIGKIVHQKKSIVKSGGQYTGFVYDLQVDEDQSYIANGVIVHNCAILPITKSYKDLGINAPEPDFSREKGEDWFRRQGDAVQQDMMGVGKWNAWKDGLFDLKDLPHQIKSDVWGNSWVPAPLWSLLGAKGPVGTYEQWLSVQQMRTGEIET